jgi:hypothetical protein
MLSRQLPSQQCTDVTAPTNGKYATRTVVPECECRGTGCNAVVPVGRGTCAAGTSMTEHRQVAKDRTVVEPGPASKVSSSMPTSCHPRPWAKSSCRTRMPARGQGVTSNGPVAGSPTGTARTCSLTSASTGFERQSAFRCRDGGRSPDYGQGARGGSRVRR